MNGYAIAFFILTILTLVGKVANHGKPRDNYNAIIGLIDFALATWLLTAGGFYKW